MDWGCTLTAVNIRSDPTESMSDLRASPLSSPLRAGSNLRAANAHPQSIDVDAMRFQRLVGGSPLPPTPPSQRTAVPHGARPDRLDSTGPVQFQSNGTPDSASRDHPKTPPPTCLANLTWPPRLSQCAAPRADGDPTLNPKTSRTQGNVGTQRDRRASRRPSVRCELNCCTVPAGETHSKRTRRATELTHVRMLAPVVGAVARYRAW